MHGVAERNVSKVLLTMEDISLMLVVLLKFVRADHAMNRWGDEQLLDALRSLSGRLHAHQQMISRVMSVLKLSCCSNLISTA